MKKSEESNFPLVDALLEMPADGKRGCIGICTNSISPGQVLNELEEGYRSQVAVLGSLIVNRDGTERMILNSLVHPTIQFIILFAEEGLTFSPSTNLLLALMHGYDTVKNGNYIKNGRAASAHYPNISSELLQKFRNNIKVLPIFSYKSNFSKAVISEYLQWLREYISEELYAELVRINNQKTIYYDALKSLITILNKQTLAQKELIALNSKDFQHLQPPKLFLPNTNTLFNVPFKVSIAENKIRVDIRLDDKVYFIFGEDDFLLQYSIMKFLGENKSQLSPLEQLLLGAEISNAKTFLANNVRGPEITIMADLYGTEERLLQPQTALWPDKKYYYRISAKGKEVSVMCLAFDICEEVFDLRSESFSEIINKLVSDNRFESYEQDILHRMDVGGQIARAFVAAQLGYAFIQDFSNIFKINTTELPFLISDNDTFLGVHKNLLTSIYTQGLTEAHGDSWKGLARTAVVLAVYRNATNSLKALPNLYKQGEQSTEEVRANYKAQLLRFDHDGSYSYGERTRSYFGFDQLERTKEILKSDPTKATIIQRFDPAVDMSMTLNPETGKMESSHDPCLTHDIFFIKDNRLHSFHIARAHNTVNAYPENIFGLFDAYVSTIAAGLNIAIGDMFMLSSRANILLLTEEQRTKRIIAEPAKPKDVVNADTGPYLIGNNVAATTTAHGVFYIHIPLEIYQGSLDHPVLSRLRNYQNTDILAKAINYLKEKGVVHNNPILTTFHAAADHPQIANALVFFQCNVFGNKLHATAVWSNRSIAHLEEDITLMRYIVSQYSFTLGFPLGNLTMFYVG